MKHTYKTLQTFIVLLCFAGLQLNAQLAGSYTINSALPTSGSNYQSFNAFANAINSQGVSGPVTVVVAPSSGPYVEQVTFNQIAGTSATNTVAINGNGNLLTFGSSNWAQPWTLLMGGADYMIFNNLNIEGTGSYAMTCKVYNQSNNNSWNNCTISCPANSTSSDQIPVCISGSSQYYYITGNGGNNNVWTGCTIKDGYFGVCFYTSTSSPFNVGNNLVNCDIRDWYVYGIYNYYHRSFTLKGNVIQRPNRAMTTTTYGIFLTTQSYGVLVEGNRVEKLFENSPGGTNTTYGIRTVAAVSASVNVFRNNIVSVTKTNGTTYGLYLGGNYNTALHNTISMDDNTSGGTGIVRAVYVTGGTQDIVRNNIVTITQGGTGTKHGLYYIAAGVTSNNNVIYINSSGGYVGYYNGNYATLANWQTANGGVWDANSFSSDPLYMNVNTNNFWPNSYVINNGGANLGVTTDINGLTRSTTNPDPGAHEFLNVPCSGIPASASVVSPTAAICPGQSALLALSTSYTNSGLTYQWQSSTTSSVGPFTSITSGTNPSLYTPTLTNSAWYTAVVTCTNSSAPGNITSGQVLVQGTTISQVPYFEGFEGISGPNKLPNCSWSANNLGNTNLTFMSPMNQNRIPHSGSKFASFYYTNAGATDYFYTNGIQLYAGVTYSASMWFTTEYYGYTNWSDLSIMVGPNQSTTNLVTVASTNGPALSGTYKALSNTFTVASSGIYYVAVKAANSGGWSYYLSWDDLSIIAPCQLGANTPSISLSANNTTVCAGQQVNLTANSNGNTFSWNTGETTSSITKLPNGNFSYVATTTNTMSNCSNSATLDISVNPSPQILVLGPPYICAGQPASLFASGANTYSWSNAVNGALNTVSPSSNTTYTVLGSNSFNCIGSATQAVTVKALPAVSGNGSAVICAGESAVLTASGAQSYTWASSNSYLQGSPVTVSPNTSTSYTLTGKDSFGCVSTAIVSQAVDACVGLKENGSVSSGVRVYPNPTRADLSIELSSGSISGVEVIDLTGRVVMTATGNSSKVSLNMAALAGGVYYVRVKSNSSSQVIKVVKQ